MIEIIRDPIEIKSLANVWNELAEHFKTPLLRNEWFAACAEAFCQPGQLLVVINKSQGEINAIAALASVQNRGFKRLELLGTSFLNEPSGFIYKDQDALEELMDGIIKMKKPVILCGLRSVSAEVFILRNMNRKCFFLVLRNAAGSPFLPIAATWAEFEANMSSRRRYDLRRARKRAETLGEVQFEIVPSNRENLDHYFEEVIHVEAAGWKGRQGTALLFDERLRSFFYLYSKAASQLGKLRLCFLRINNELAAALLAVEYFNRFWVLKIGYDEAFSRCSPGILLIHETIRYAFENELDAYEFLGSNDPWIHMWTEQNHAYLTARIYPLSVGGSFRLATDAALAVAKRALMTGN